MQLLPLTTRPKKKQNLSRLEEMNSSRIEKEIQSYNQLLLDKKQAESNQTNQIKRKIEMILNRGGV
jgi:hypothetical protein